jgi:hypothetical protein
MRLLAILCMWYTARHRLIKLSCFDVDWIPGKRCSVSQFVSSSDFVRMLALAYEEHSLQLTSLQYRRLKGDAFLAWKYLHGPYTVDWTSFLPMVGAVEVQHTGSELVLSQISKPGLGAILLYNRYCQYMELANSWCCECFISQYFRESAGQCWGYFEVSYWHCNMWFMYWSMQRYFWQTLLDWRVK